jgi:pimeloyl-ACP methyl ester carboxylesterase
MSVPFSTGTNYDVTVSEVSFGNGKTTLKGRLLYPETGADVPAAILCHGFGTGYRTVESSARMLARRGVASLIFDFRGHGKSDGIVDESIVDDVIAAWNFLKSCCGVDRSRIALAGHSMGAMAAILAAGIVRPQALVAMSCPPEIDGDLSKLSFAIPVDLLSDTRKVMQYPRDGSLPWVTGFAGFVSQIWMRIARYQVKVNWRRFSNVVRSARLRSTVRDLRDCAMLFVHCDGDNITPCETAMALYESATGPREVMISEGGFHSTPVLAGKVQRCWTDWTVDALSAS